MKTAEKIQNRSNPLAAEGVRSGSRAAVNPPFLHFENPGAPAHAVRHSDIMQRDNAPGGMLPNLGDLLTKRELRDIVGYVASIKQPRAAAALRRLLLGHHRDAG